VRSTSQAKWALPARVVSSAPSVGRSMKLSAAVLLLIQWDLYLSFGERPRKINDGRGKTGGRKAF
jgi:hypothetical protein